MYQLVGSKPGEKLKDLTVIEHEHSLSPEAKKQVATITNTVDKLEKSGTTLVMLALGAFLLTRDS